MEKIDLQSFLKLKKKDLRGKIVCFPTDTVYGVGAMYGDQIAIDKIYAMKHRDRNKPLANLCSSVAQIEKLNIPISSQARALMDKYWPGGLTIILKGNDKTISFRMPDSPIALGIIRRFSLMTTTSVNESGEPELNSITEIEKAFGAELDYFITDEAAFSKVPSTVVDATGDKLVVLRQGKIDVYS
jgi:L-threonylcarbamoyladenylate synthase